ncbi:MAG: hypothetical protein V4760_11015, partial [Bdellovibrionota bacterium]
MKKQALAFAFSLLTLSSLAQAKIETLFHPTDPTLPKIGQWIRETDRTIDIAMYNMETGGSSPVVEALKEVGDIEFLHTS